MRVPFDKYDTAILLEAYLQVEDGTLTRRQAAEKASKELRQRAIDRGMEIDDQFRNYAGIRKQLDVMEFNYTDGKRGYEKRTKIFIEVIDLYRSHREEYEQILREARGMSAGKTVENQFLSWLAMQVPTNQLSDLYLALRDAEKFCLRKGILSCSLFETTEQETIQMVLLTVKTDREYRMQFSGQLKIHEASVQYYLTWLQKEWHRIPKSVWEVPVSRTAEPVRTSSAAAVSEPRAAAVITAPAPESEPATVSAPIWFREDGTANPDQESFRLWLTQEKEQNAEEAERLAAAVRTCEGMAKKMHMPNSSFYQTSLPRVKDTISRLEESSDFQYSDKKEDRLLSRALTAYTEYLSASPSLKSSSDPILRLTGEADLSSTKPVSLTYFGKTYRDFSNWRNLGMDLMMKLLRDYPIVLRKQVNHPLPGDRKVYITNAAFRYRLKSAFKIGENFYIETSLTNTEWGRFIQKVLICCSVKSENAVIVYQSTADAAAAGSGPDGQNAREKEPARAEIRQNGFPEVDYTSQTNLQMTIPMTLTYFGEKYTGFSDWKELYVQLTKLLYAEFPAVLRGRINKNIQFGKSAPDFGNERFQVNLHAPQKIADDFYLETEYSSTVIVQKIRQLLDLCEVSYRSVVITYTRKTEQAPKERVQISASAGVLPSRTSSVSTNIQAAAAAVPIPNPTLPVQKSAPEGGKTSPASVGQEQTLSAEQRPAVVSELKPEQNSAPVREEELKPEPASETEPMKSVPEQESSDSTLMTLDLSNTVSAAFTKPVSYVYYGKVVDNLGSWRELYIGVLQELYNDYDDRLRSRINRSINEETGRIDFADGDHRQILRTPIWIAEDFYAEGNLSATDIVKRIRAALDLCGVGYENLVITFRRTGPLPSVQSVPPAVPLGNGSTTVPAAAETGGKTDRQVQMVMVTPDPEGFTQWMVQVRGIYRGNARYYAYAIKTCERIAKSENLSACRLYGVGLREARDASDQLRRSQAFKMENAEQGNRLSKALSRYMKYLQSGSVILPEVRAEEQMATEFAPAPGPEYVSEKPAGAQPRWDIEEAVILMDGLLRSRKGEISQATAIQEVSDTLRKRAVSKGMTIDATFRNVPGIRLHMYGMEKMLIDGDHSNDVSRLFRQVVDLYRNDRDEYERILKAAKAGLTGTPAVGTPPASTSSGPVRKENRAYRSILEEFFPKGFRTDSVIDMKKFRRFYQQKYGNGLTAADQAIYADIAAMTVNHEGKAYLPEAMLSEEKKAKLLGYIEETFAGGVSVIYYKALYQRFSEEFQGERIYSPEMLRTYLSYVNEGRYAVQGRYLAKNWHVKVDSAEEIRAYLREQTAPVAVDQMYADLSYLPKQKINGVLHGGALYDNEFVWNAKGVYFHADMIEVSRSELERAAQFIDTGITEHGFVTGNELVEAVSGLMPELIEQHPEVSQTGMRDAFRYKLQDRFAFNGNIISAKDENLSMADVYAQFCLNRRHFTLDELNVLKNELGSTIYFDTIYANSLRISEAEFVSRDQARFDVQETDEAISRFCTGEYLPLQEVRMFGTFPNAGFPWNGYLLEHYVSDFSRMFRLVHSGFSANACAGAIVRRSSGITEFDDLLADVLAKTGIQTESEALAYLCDSGYLARRRYSSIGKILTAAKAARPKKEG